MQTKYLHFQEGANKEAIEEAALLLQSGELVAFPTETVYGLGADATNAKAVDKIFQAKGRPGDNPLIVHLAEESQMIELVEVYPDYVDKLIAAFSPGPITYVLTSNGKVSDKVTAGLDTVGIRIPRHPAAKALLQTAKRPIAAPSANLSGKPSPTTAEHVKQDMQGKIAAILDGGSSDVGVESTVIDCTGEYPVILRLGGITAAAINEIIPVYVNEARKVNQPKSPGTKYQHYMPEIPLILVNDRNTLQKVIHEARGKGNRVGALVTDQTAKEITADKIYSYGNNEQELARRLYESLRMMNRHDVDIVYAEKVSADTVGQAVLDRLTRAATSII